MANIDKELNDIKHAIFGKQVRPAIESGLRKVNEESEESRNKSESIEKQFEDLIEASTNNKITDNQETIAARTNKVINVKHKTLGARLDHEFKINDEKIKKKADKVEVKELSDTTRLALEKLNAKLDGRPVPEPEVVINLWDVNKTVDGLLSTASGNLNPSSNNKTTDFIKIAASTNYTFSRPEKQGVLEGTDYRFVYYDKDKKYVSGDQYILCYDPEIGVIPCNKTHKTPKNAQYMRVSVGRNSIDDFLINIGSKVMNPEDEGVIWDGGFWEGVPTPPLREDSVYEKHIVDNQITENKLSFEVKEKLNRINSSEEDVLSPFPEKLNFVEVSKGWEEVVDLSRDGKVLYFKSGATLKQSFDDGDTMQDIVNIKDLDSSIPSIRTVRETYDDELLLATTRDESKGLKSKVFKSVGYDRNNPNNTKFVEVLEAISSQANIYDSWGLECHDNVCLASEYGLRGENGARHVYLSTDYGNSWKVIFDQKTYVDKIKGAPKWTESAHLHTSHYDRYRNRIWLVVGDNPNTATYYSDDLGETWKFVEGSDQMQYTGIVSFKDGVVFGSDRAPNGLHFWRDSGNINDKVLIRPLKLINDYDKITHVFQRAFRRYDSKDEVALFPATRIADYRGVYGSVILGFTGLDNPHILYELPKNHEGLGFYNVLGITERGNIVTNYYNGTNHSIMRAKAPVWE